MHRTRPRLVPALVSALVLAATTLIGPAVLAPTVLAANTRVVYFGSPDCVNAPGGCPPAGTTSAAFWSSIYPYGTGGSYLASGQPVAGQNSYSPVTTGGSSATDIVISNATKSTLTQIVFTGGTAAPQPINTASVPAMPSPPTPADPGIFNADGTAAVPSLPPGLYYQAIYVVSNPAAIPVKCTFSASSGVPTGLADGLSCAIGNLAKGQGVSLRVIVADAAAAAATYEPWFELGLKEGTSTTGSNSDTFFTYSEMSVGNATCANVATFFLDGKPVALSNGAVGCAQTTGVTTTNGFTDGTLAIVGNQDSTLCLPGLTCFGQLSTASVAGGAQIAGGLEWTIVLPASVVPNSGPKTAIHFLDNGTYQQIYFKPKYQCGTTITKFCWVSVTQDKTTGNWTIILESPTNGSIRFG